LSSAIVITKLLEKLHPNSKKRRSYLVVFRRGVGTPQIAAYYGVILAGIGNFPRPAKFLDLGAKANLLPEERKLVEKAQLTIARR
jgi:hypothetical protein